MAEYSVDFVPPSSFVQEAKDLIKDMTMEGWAFRLSSKGHAIGRAPAPSTLTVSISRSANLTNRGLQNAMAVFRRWIREQAAQSQPQGMEALEAAYTASDSPVVTAVITRGVARKMADEYERRREEEHRAAVAQAEALIVGAVTDAVKEAESPVLVEVNGSGFTLVPWLARKKPGVKGGERYQSSGVMERRWDDGRVDYVCSIVECGFESDNPRSVSSHYGAAHTRVGEGTSSEEARKHVVPDMSYTEPVSHHTYRPSDRLVIALTEYLAEALDRREQVSAEELAVAALTWFHERPDLEDLERQPVKELTAEEIVARVRMLVGQPLAVKVQSMEERVAELEAKLEQRTAERDAVTAELRRVEQDVDALDELLDTIRGHRQ